MLAPVDWERVELSLATTNAVEHLSLPYDPATRRLFGIEADPEAAVQWDDALWHHLPAALRR